MLVGAALALTVVGAAVWILTTPPFTAIMSVRVSDARAIGAPASEAPHLAEQVRAYVASEDGATLPDAPDGRPAFDRAAAQHLADVRHVVAGSRVATAVLSALCTLWIAVGLMRRRTERIAAGLRAGAIGSLAFVAIGALLGVLDFDTLFVWFHSIFFAEGTWVFPADSLLIGLFPESFWIVAGASLAALVAAGGGLLWVAALWVSRSATCQDPLAECPSGE